MKVGAAAGTVGVLPGTDLSGVAAATGPKQRWSDPATWGGSTPGNGDEVTIPANEHVVLDENPPKLEGVTVHGTLEFSDDFYTVMTVGGSTGPAIDLETKWLLADGPDAKIEIGTDGSPYGVEARITLYGTDESHNLRGQGEMAIGTKLLGTWDEGSIEIVGESREKTDWTQIDDHANAGDRKLRLAESVNWEPGDMIAIAPSGSDPWQFERHTVKSVNGTTVTLEDSLEYDHYGAVETHGGKDLDMRAEVGLLTRNVELRGAEDSYASSGMGPDSEYATGFGGHGIFAKPTNVRIEGLEAFRCGQTGHQARYPLHFHHGHELSNSSISHNSVWHSLQRGINCHGTGNVRVEGNVVHDVVGHGFLIEQGLPSEKNNELVDNLVIFNQRVKDGDRAFGGEPNIIGDGQEQNGFRSGAFWISNPSNLLKGNHAAGGHEANGFFYDGRGVNTEGQKNIDLENAEVQFEDNTAHSFSAERQLPYKNLVRGNGLLMQIEPDEFLPAAIPIRRDDEVVGFTSYKNDHSGLWTEWRTTITKDTVVADFNNGEFKIGGSETHDTVFVGRSATDNDIAPPPDDWFLGQESAAILDDSAIYRLDPEVGDDVEYVDVENEFIDD